MTDHTNTTPPVTGAQTPPTFTSFNLPTSLIDQLAIRGITTPTDVQVEAIPLVTRRQNLIVQAKTGTGKTFAFGLPLLALLDSPRGDTPRALVVAPTRELALQVHRDLSEFGAVLGLRTVAVYGGADATTQINALRAGVDIVVGTPGRLLDLASQHALRLSGIEHVVLDEADEMLDMGFLPDITKLLTLASNRSQTLLFSATMPTEIRQLARRFATNPYFIQVADPNADTASVALVTQHVYKTHPLDKPEVLARLLQAGGRGPSIVFCRTKRWAQRISDEMNERGFNTAALHGDLTQVARERALEQFRNGNTDVLIATDVAARGIDIDGITHVVNYDAPEDAATYLHRIGRTARAGRSGIAVTFVDLEVIPRWVFIARDLGLAEDPAETFSTSAHLFTELDIPEGTRGRLRSVAQPTRQINVRTAARVGAGRDERTRTRTRRRGQATKSANVEAAPVGGPDAAALNSEAQQQSVKQQITKHQTVSTGSQDGNLNQERSKPRRNRRRRGESHA